MTLEPTVTPPDSIALLGSSNCIINWPWVSFERLTEQKRGFADVITVGVPVKEEYPYDVALLAVLRIVIVGSNGL